MRQNKYDFIFLGGGLASGLAVWRLLQAHPLLRVLILERSAKLGGDHTWSFHSHDVSKSALKWLEPLIKKSWKGYSVFFPNHQRSLHSGYHSIRSEDFHTLLSKKLGEVVKFGADVKLLSDEVVTLESGESYHANLVIDGRGFSGPLNRSGFQKFFGLDVTLEEPHGLVAPILMDATVAQTDGFRFVYTLPWSERTLLVEDTYYSDTSSIDEQLCKNEVLGYIARRGWKIKSIDRAEVGCLPIPLVCDSAPNKHCIGVKAQLFNPTTGYSLPYAVEFAETLENLEDPGRQSVQKCIENFGARARQRNRFFYFLNRMLFLAAEPKLRDRVLERFYKLPEKIIRRFYSSRLTLLDSARILLGRPPIPVSNVMKCFKTKGDYAYG